LKPHSSILKSALKYVFYFCNHRTDRICSSLFCN
jgi:hypothetical protein